MAPLRLELNRTKDLYNKERSARLASQQETAFLKERVGLLEKQNHDLDREAKTLPAMAESNEILRNDIAQLRQRYKEDKHAMQLQMRSLDLRSSEVEKVKSEVRTLAMKLLDVSTGSSRISSQNHHINQTVPPGQFDYRSSMDSVASVQSGLGNIYYDHEEDDADDNSTHGAKDKDLKTMPAAMDDDTFPDDECARHRQNLPKRRARKKREGAVRAIVDGARQDLIHHQLQWQERIQNQHGQRSCAQIKKSGGGYMFQNDEDDDEFGGKL